MRLKQAQILRQAEFQMIKKCTTMRAVTARYLKSGIILCASIVASLPLTGFVAAQNTSLPAAVMTSAPDNAQAIKIAKDAPDKHIVVRGDTLWGISAKFLESPWRWPEVWQMNREQIRNPHLIYPGDVVYLDRSGNSPRLRLGKAMTGSSNASTEPIGRIEPMVRSEPIDRAPIPTVSSRAIEAFLNRPLIVEQNTLDTSPRIIGTPETRLYVSRGETFYARGFDASAEANSNWHIYRPARPILDPDTRKPIAYEAIYIGSARLEKNGDPATLRIVGTAEEIGEGDRLVKAEPARTFNYSPKPPDTAVNGRLVSVYNGVSQAGKNSVIAVSLGKSSGIDVGTVLGIKQKGREVVDRQTKEKIRLPDETIGYVLVFRTFDKISYGLIMETTGYPNLGDIVTNP